MNTNTYLSSIQNVRLFTAVILAVAVMVSAFAYTTSAYAQTATTGLPTCSMVSEPGSLKEAGTVKLTWKTVNADGVTLWNLTTNQPVGSTVPGNGEDIDVNGSKNVEIDRTTNFRLDVWDAQSRVVQCSVTVIIGSDNELENQLQSSLDSILKQIEIRGGTWPTTQVTKVNSGTTNQNDSSGTVQGLNVTVNGMVANARFWAGVCDGYDIDWGDGKRNSVRAQSQSDTCVMVSQSLSSSHTYSKAGNYTVTLTIGSNKQQALIKVGHQSVSSEKADDDDEERVIESLRELVRDLIKRVQALNGEVNLEAGSASGDASCPILSRNLWRGVNGNDVSSLQRFLALDNSVYPEGEVTGFFGVATERAVQRFQEKNNIVSSGTIDTTGYGFVGPMTREAIVKKCNQ